ncbi:NfeD family protein [Desulfocurvus sp. DL9XJH121]
MRNTFVLRACCTALVFVFLAFSGWVASSAQDAAPDAGFVVLCGELDGPVTPAAEDALRGLLHQAVEQGARAVLVRLDTPGGLAESMREMVKQILASPVPVVVWVGPSGARAASAGVFLVAASHVAAMSPQSTIGAASPVSMGGKDMDATLRSKIENDILSLVRGVAKSRGRNVAWYERSVREAVSVSADEAVMLEVVEYVALDREDLFRQVAARGFFFHGKRLEVPAETLRFQDFEPGVRHTLLSWLLNPQVAYLLLLGGMAGLFFEFTTPGAVFPGVFGGLCLILGLYALSVLPTNAAGVLLILFALVLLILEIYVTSFGMLGVAALTALFFGSTILFDPSSGLPGLPLGLILSTIIPLAVLMGGCLVLISRAHRARPALGAQAMVGLTAEVRTWRAREGVVFVRGELWRASSDADLSSGQRVRVVAVEGLMLHVEPAAPDATDANDNQP